MYIGLHVKYPLFLSDLKDLEFCRQIFEIAQISNFMKIRRTGTELIHAGGWKDRQRHTWQSWQSLFAILRTCLKTINSTN